MSYPGLGLTTYPWGGFVNLLNAASNNTPGWNEDFYYTNLNNTGFTSKNNAPCSAYSSLWDFSFQVYWNNTASYLTVPLSTFASQNSYGGCTLNIYENEMTIFGSPFFTSFYTEFV